MSWTLLAAYAATVPLANWMVENVGTVCVPAGPCLLPLGFGLMSPSGVLVVGLSFVLRDLVQRRLGTAWGLACILLGTALSALLAPPALVVASAVSFAVSETVDFAVYTPLARRRFLLAVALSSAAASVIDSAAFLLLAFGSLDYLAGQVAGKWVAVLVGTAVVAFARRVR